MLLFLNIDQPVAQQDPMDGGPRGCPAADLAAQLMGDPPSTPASVVPAHLADQRFDVGTDAARAGMRSPGLVGQPVQAARLVAFAPGGDRLPRNPETLRDLPHGSAIHDLGDRAKAHLDSDPRGYIGIRLRDGCFRHTDRLAPPDCP